MKEEESSTQKSHAKKVDLLGNSRGLFWSISIFSSSSQNFFQQFFSAFARLAGVSATILGFVMSVRNLLTGLFQGVVGRLSDKLGRKFILIAGFIIGVIIPIPLLFFENTYLLIAVAVIQAFSVSVVTPTWNAVLGDVTEPENRAAFIGKVTSVGRIVSVTFTLLVALVFFFVDFYSGWVILGWFVYLSWRVQYSVAFAISAFNSLLCIISMLFFKETRIVDPKNNHVPKMRIAFQDKHFVKFLIVNSIWGITMAMIWPTNPIILVDQLELDFWQVAIMTSAFTVFTAFAQILGGKLSDRIGKRKPLILISIFVLLFFPVSMVPAITADSWPLLLLSRFVGGLGTGINLVAVSAYTLDLAPNDLMGGYSGLREVFYGIATFIGSFISGFIIDAFLVNYSIKTTVIIMSIGVTVLRVFAAIGFLFISESMAKSATEKAITK